MSKVRKDENISDLEKKLTQIEKKNNIFYSDALAGYGSGIHINGEGRR
jgi:hypothetical protein